MSAPAWLTRLSLSRAASARALLPLLVPGKPGDRARSGHNLMWALFGDSPGSKRDFLWREEGQGRFILLSARPPQDNHQLFEPFEPKPFEPVFAAGDHLRFLLRANATVRHRGDPKHRDVVMDAIHALPKGERANARRTAEQEASRRWLDAQGAAHGFAVTDLACLGYETLSLARSRGADIQLGVVDLEGRLTVTDPERFAEQLLSGFGRARAFGCGLMLVAPLG